MVSGYSVCVMMTATAHVIRVFWKKDQWIGSNLFLITPKPAAFQAPWVFILATPGRCTDANGNTCLTYLIK
ncbi:hypothetical protein DESC_480263 [Desulfosarcina cetonica]|nr:hypothetical protein DESC_480263 [Desulfosarcina cetonica]